LEKTVVAEGCNVGAIEFEAVCNVVLDMEGGEVACALGGIAIKELCDHYGDDWIKAHLDEAVASLCHDMHLC
jgi:hypothetical protein